MMAGGVLPPANPGCRSDSPHSERIGGADAAIESASAACAAYSRAAVRTAGRVHGSTAVASCTGLPVYRPPLVGVCLGHAETRDSIAASAARSLGLRRIAATSPDSPGGKTPPAISKRAASQRVAPVLEPGRANGKRPFNV